MTDQPNITVGIMDRKTEVFGRMNGNFYGDRFGPLSGRFLAKARVGMVLLTDETHHEICRSPLIKLKAYRSPLLRTRQEPKARSGQTFTLFNVTIGNGFHWERSQDQSFQGDLILQLRDDGTIAVINEIDIEDYLRSVISSEMNPASPMEFLKAHAILSRSWLLAGLVRKKKRKRVSAKTTPPHKKVEEFIHWYDREDHDLYDVCADDHCQRYQGITKIISKRTKEAVQKTQGKVITYRDEICDARYSKACGGITEEYHTAWDDQRVPYLRSISDTTVPHPLIKTEKEARRWILSNPEGYCNLKDEDLLKQILSGSDHKTKKFFRWRVKYSREELEEILRKKSGLDFGTLKEIVPLQRGSSGRISRLKIIGSKRSVIVGKELVIRHWLSPTHLYSSAFVVEEEANQFIFHGAGWGHGVGLCQIGAAVMGAQGFSAEEILKHYFRGVEIKKVY